jgi:hypothetical protein
MATPFRSWRPWPQGGVPVVIHTGIGLPQEARDRFPAVPVHAKPTPATMLVAALAQLLAASSGARREPRGASGE